MSEDQLSTAECSICGEEYESAEGTFDADGEFMCLTCAENTDGLDDVCPECGTSSSGFQGEEGSCDNCGYTKQVTPDED